MAERMELDDLWEQYHHTRSAALKNQLVMQYLPLVRTIVMRMMPIQQMHNFYEDLIHCGVMGLMNAIDRFDPSRDVKFATYAYMRIRGEIIDNLRKQDWASSNLRRQISAVTRAYDELEVKLERTPADHEVADHLDMTTEELQRVLDKSHSFNLIYFEDLLSDNYADSEALQDESSKPGDRLEKDELRSVMVKVVDSLPKNERLVVSLYYFEELPFKDIAQALGVSVSRVSQIHSKVIGKLRELLHPYMTI